MSVVSVFGHKYKKVSTNNRFFFKYFIDKSLERFKTYGSFFEDDEKFNRVDENKRIDKNNRFNSSHGLEGSFKKLELD